MQLLLTAACEITREPPRWPVGTELPKPYTRTYCDCAQTYEEAGCCCNGPFGSLPPSLPPSSLPPSYPSLALTSSLSLFTPSVPPPSRGCYDRQIKAMVLSWWHQQRVSLREHTPCHHGPYALQQLRRRPRAPAVRFIDRSPHSNSLELPSAHTHENCGETTT